LASGLVEIISPDTLSGLFMASGIGVIITGDAGSAQVSGAVQVSGTVAVSGKVDVGQVDEIMSGLIEIISPDTLSGLFIASGIGVITTGTGGGQVSGAVQVSGEVSIDEAGTLLNIQVEVQITHTYRGDLRVQLEAPSGKTVTLHSHKGGRLDNLYLSLDSKDFAQLAALVGESIQGKWKLHVSDLLRDDVGRLDTWSLTIEYQSPDKISRGEVDPNIVVPDADFKGVQSSIHIAKAGKVKGLSVEVDISHTWLARNYR